LVASQSETDLKFRSTEAIAKMKINRQFQDLQPAHGEVNWVLKQQLDRNICLLSTSSPITRTP